ncbi:HNH endonuclease [Flagellimonas sp. SN16]|uniref:HNH endonuclease n=1 Tax=Flagellimonas sp. SN16 TaxID=3415142 RepID=UPI003C643A66
MKERAMRDFDKDFKAVKGFEDLEISRKGVILKNGFIYTPFVANTGYLSVSFYKEGISHCFLVHRLLAKAFIPNPNNLRCINHKDGNKLNNSLDNLEWCTYSHNNKHAIENGLREVVVPDNSRPLIQKTKDGIVLKIWKSAKEAALVLGFEQRGIGKAIRNEKPSYKGYAWERF